MSSVKKRSRSTTEGTSSGKPTKARKITFQVQSSPTALTASFSRSFPPSSVFEDAQIVHKVPEVDPLVEIAPTEAPHLLEIESGSLSYSGKSVESPSSRYYVGVFNKKTNDLTVLPSKFFTVEQNFDHSKSKHLTVKSVGTVSREELVSRFSGAKAHRKFKQIHESLVPHTYIEGLNRKSQVDVERTDLPPHDTETTFAEEVYDIESFCPVELASAHIETWIEAIEKKEFEDLHSAGIVQDALKHLSKVKLSKEDREIFCAKVRYLGFMVDVFQKFKQSRFRDVKKHAFALPEDILNDILSKFAENGQRTPSLSVVLEKKFIHHILILALSVSGNAVDTTVAAKDLLMPAAKLKQHVQSIGCALRVVKEEVETDTSDIIEIKKTVGVLKAPLKLSTRSR